VGLLVGCSRDNPWFYLDHDSGATTTATTGAGTAEHTASTPDPGTTTTTTTTDTDETADAGSGDSGAVVDTDTGSTSTTTGETTGATTGVADTSGTDATDATGMAETTSGEPTEGEVWHDLWALCPDPATDWQAFGIKAGGLECDVDFDKPEQWAGWLPPAIYMGQLEPKVLGLVPAVGQGNLITGTYTGLTLTDANTPHLRTVVGCPLNPPMCEIKGNIRVEQDGATVVGVENFILAPGATLKIDIDLSLHPELLDGTPFNVVLVVTAKNGGQGNRGAWLYPRIVEVTQ